jgi:hypothetical protein
MAIITARLAGGALDGPAHPRRAGVIGNNADLLYSS